MLLKEHKCLKQENMMNDLITSIEDICAGLINAFQEPLTWEWDGRFGAVLATCTTENKEDVQLSLKSHFKTIWDNSNTEEAPDAVLDAISHFGGLMPGQLLFTSDLNLDILLCCAWWPWGDGETFSIRVAPYSKKISDEDKTELSRKFKEWFRI
jgi:hypothetical protein